MDGYQKDTFWQHKDLPLVGDAKKFFLDECHKRFYTHIRLCWKESIRLNARRLCNGKERTAHVSCRNNAYANL